ncbi:MAG: alkane 1-monooxygenase [Microthrixaceae bacterium]|nr:alkane 1-monooxygenase [Microthrixaceae bacterium]
MSTTELSPTEPDNTGQDLTEQEKGGSGATGAAPYVDTRRYLWAIGLLVPALPLASAGLAAVSGSDLWWWLTPAFIYLLIPALDAILGTDTANPPEEVVASLEADHYYRWLTYLYLPLQYISFLVGAWLFVDGAGSWVTKLAIAVSVGGVGGIGIANAHELGHKKAKVERRLSKFVLAQTAYGHFYVEHNRGHHNRVATPEDPASSRMGETFWAFLPRTVWGSLRSAWELEAKRLRAHDQRVFSWRNDVLNSWAITVVLFAAVTVWLGAAVVPFLVIQAVFGFCLLEVVNYVEHYGLLRQRLDSGRYERCRPVHSWNSNHVASNVALYNLERHSDHHAHPTRRYQSLRHFDESPQLPNGYGLMIGLAYFPPIWRRMMDHRVVEHYEGDLGLANLAPSKREQLLRRWS